MNHTNSTRIESLDLLKGLIMILMALDHVRDFFHRDAFLFDPTEIEKSNLPLFFTRFATNICAPAFCLLAGTAAFLVGMRKPKLELARFLLTRGAWLVFIELTVVNFGWYFDTSFRMLSFGVIGALGTSMICLSVLIFLPRKAIFGLSLALIFGHNLLDGVHAKHNIAWALLHEAQTIPVFGVKLDIYYPVLPWLGTMLLGFFIGTWYKPDVEAHARRRFLRRIGIASFVLFVGLRTANYYGDLAAWQTYAGLDKTLMSYLNVQKYPPSLDFLLLNLSLVFLFLANSETWRGRAVSVFSTYGRIPFFYYILHLYLIHGLAVVVAGVSGSGWELFLLPAWITEVPALKGYGFGLPVVYAVWLAVVVALYPLCKWFDAYKKQHKEKWYLSYL